MQLTSKANCALIGIIRDGRRRHNWTHAFEATASQAQPVPPEFVRAALVLRDWLGQAKRPALGATPLCLAVDCDPADAIYKRMSAKTALVCLLAVETIAMNKKAVST